MVGRASRYEVEAAGLPLSLKTIAGGRARYRIGRHEMTMDDRGWLVVNEGQAYAIEIAEPVPVETFIVWFPRGWAEDAWHGASRSSGELLTTPGAETRVGFDERYMANDDTVAPLARRLRLALARGRAAENSWLEERLRELLAGMFAAQSDLRRQVARLPALRAATREELWRRLNRARDFLHAHCETGPSLTDAARVAALSPYHLLRTFRAAFGLTPHGWLTACRLERAKFLLAATTAPVTEVCGLVGYDGLGTFSAWFRQRTGLPPRAWRRAHGRRSAIRNIQEVSTPSDPVTSPASA